jgi:hypothetical protein
VIDDKPEKMGGQLLRWASYRVARAGDGRKQPPEAVFVMTDLMLKVM